MSQRLAFDELARDSLSGMSITLTVNKYKYRLPHD